MKNQIESANKIADTLIEAVAQDCLEVVLPVLIETNKYYALDSEGRKESLYHTICVTVDKRMHDLFMLSDTTELTEDQKDELQNMITLRETLVTHYGK